MTYTIIRGNYTYIHIIRLQLFYATLCLFLIIFTNLFIFTSYPKTFKPVIMELKLIKFIESNPFLYDHNHTSYRNHTLKEEKWTEISRTLNFPARLLKKRWKSLRDRYFRLRRIDDPDDTAKSKYKYYTHLQFLGNVGKSKKRLTNSHEINKKSVDDTLTKSEDRFHLDQASFSTFYFDNEEISNPTSTTEKCEPTEDIEEVLLQDSNMFSRNSTPFRAFLESIALTVEKANFDINELMRLQISILEVVQNEVKNRVNQ